MQKQSSKMTGRQVELLNKALVGGFAVMCLAMVFLCGWTLAIDPTWMSTVLVAGVLGGLSVSVMAWWITANYA